MAERDLDFGYKRPTVESDDESRCSVGSARGADAPPRRRAASGQHEASDADADANGPSPWQVSLVGGWRDDLTDAAPRASSFPGLKPSTSDQANIFVQDGIGRKLSFPFKLARTWLVSWVPVDCLAGLC